MGDVAASGTYQAAMREEIAAGGPIGATMMKIAEFYVKSYETMYPGIAGCGLHDPLVVAIAEDRSLATIEPMCIDIELVGTITRGRMVADRRHSTAGRENADVCLTVDGGRFSERFVAALKGLGG